MLIFCTWGERESPESGAKAGSTVRGTSRECNSLATKRQCCKTYAETTRVNQTSSKLLSVHIYIYIQRSLQRKDIFIYVCDVCIRRCEKEVPERIRNDAEQRNTRTLLKSRVCGSRTSGACRFLNTHSHKHMCNLDITIPRERWSRRMRCLSANIFFSSFLHFCHFYFVYSGNLAR